MDLGIQDRVAMVLGGGGGLGGAIASALAEEGAKVAVADISPEAASANADEINQRNGRALSLQWDLAQFDAIDPNVKRIEREFGPIGILINNTGGPPPTPAHGQSPELGATHFQAMVLSVIAITDRVLPKMKEKGWGRIITSTSSGVVAPIPNLGISNALRMSLVGWSKTLACEVGAFGITANIVLPGRVATRRITYLDEQKAKRENRDVADVSRESTAAIPIGRYGDPREYGDVVAFLASDRASYITGSVIRVDGGLIQSV